MTQIIKQLNIENWPLEYVCQWLKGVSRYADIFIEAFESNQINGKKLSILELSDLSDLIHEENINLSHILPLFKSIQNLMQIKHDLNRETLHGLIFNTRNRLNSILICIERIQNCGCNNVNDCEKCKRIRNHDIVSYSSSLALSHRKLISWLVRIPFTRLKPFEKFREEINNQMKNFLKLFRKMFADNFLTESNNQLNSMLNCCNKMLDYCDKSCEDENGKISVAFSCCYLEKVVLRRRTPNQLLGLKLTSLNDGIFTIAEIVRESAADECSHLNVEDDIIAVNRQIIVGWSSENILRLLEDSFISSNSVDLLLRKMPKDHVTSIKQQKNLVFMYKNANQNGSKSKQQNSTSSGHHRKLSFSDIFLSEEFVLEDSSDEEEYNDFNNNKDDCKLSSNDLMEILNKKSKNGEPIGSRRKFSMENLFEKKDKSDKNSNKNKLAKLAKKSNKSRLIKSMQNLFFYDRSRSNSADNLASSSDEKSKKSSSKSSNDTESETQKKSRKKSIEDNNSSPKIVDSSGKSDLIKSFFTNKRWDLAPNNQKKIEATTCDSIDTPNLINVKKLDSIKRNSSSSNVKTNSSSSSLNDHLTRSKQNQDENMSPNCSPSLSMKTVSSKPPIDKRAYKMQTQKPAMQGWLFKRKQSTSDSSSSLAISPSSNGSTVSNSSGSSTKNSHNLLKNHISRGSKWKKIWCVLMKDYITFYKQQEDKTPKDFLLLKDFEIKESKHKHGFIIFDKTKQCSHEFYSENNDEYQEWYQTLIELHNKLIGEPMNSLSSTSLSSSSGYDTMSATGPNSLISQMNRDDLSISSSTNSSSVNSLSQSLPSSSTLNRKNNLQLQLSTIIDQNDDANGNFNNLNNCKYQQYSSKNTSPTLIQNHQHLFNNSSRESSPDISNNNSKLASRDSSPSLIYPYQQDAEAGFTTSESDAEIYSKTLSPEKPELIKEITTRNSKNQNKNPYMSAFTVASMAATSAASIPTGCINSNNNKKQASSSPSPTSASSNTKFVYDYHENNQDMTQSDQEKQQQQQRCNSLPGSLQACVGSFVNSNNSKSNNNNNSNSNNNNNNNIDSPKTTNISSPQAKTQTNQQLQINAVPITSQHVQQSYQTVSSPGLSQSKIEKNPISSALQSSSITTSLSTPNPPSPNSVLIQKPIISTSTSQVQHQNRQQSQPQQPYSYFYQQKHDQNLPLTPPSTATRKISVQLGPNGITQINTFNFMSPSTPDQQQQQPYVVATLAHKTNTVRKQPLPSLPNSQSIVYRTELTIMPSTFNSSASSVGSNSPHNITLPSSLSKFMASNIDKRTQKK